jgi:hypothetical protein
MRFEDFAEKKQIPSSIDVGFSRRTSEKSGNFGATPHPPSRQRSPGFFQDDSHHAPRSRRRRCRETKVLRNG